MRTENDGSSSAGTHKTFLLEDYLPYRLGRVVGAMVERQARLVKAQRLNVNETEWRILAIVQDRSPITTRDLIANSSLDPVKISRSLITLEQKGLVERRPHPGDNRAHVINITNAGSAVCSNLGQVCLRLEHDITMHLTRKELFGLIKSLEKLENVLLDSGDNDDGPSDVGNEGNSGFRGRPVFA